MCEIVCMCVMCEHVLCACVWCICSCMHIVHECTRVCVHTCVCVPCVYPCTHTRALCALHMCVCLYTRQPGRGSVVAAPPPQALLAPPLCRAWHLCPPPQTA